MPLPGFLSRAQIAKIAAQVVGDRLLGQPDQDILTASLYQNFKLGSKLQLDDRVFRYAQAGTPALTVATLQQAPVPDSTHIGLVPVGTYAAGATVITLTLGVNPVTANQYKDGYLYINTGTGAGQKFRVVSHPAAGAGPATCAFTLEKGIVVATAANSRFSLVANSFIATIITATPPTSHILGVTNIPVVAGYFYWLQTKGPAAVLTDGVVLIGAPVEPSIGTAGAVRNMSNHFTTGTTGTADSASGALALNDQGAESVLRLMGTAATTTYNIGQVSRLVGHVLRVNSNGQYSLIDLALEP